MRFNPIGMVVQYTDPIMTTSDKTTVFTLNLVEGFRAGATFP